MPLSDYFSPAQIAALRAAFSRIIPSDEFPGALENGVEEYLAGQFTRDLASSVPLYRSGLTALDSEAVARCGKAFAQLDAAQRDELLTAIERGDVQTEWAVSPRLFFEMLVNHSAEGFYGDSGNGANIDKDSWRMIGFLDRR